jgi:hypothetical protein
VLRREFAGTVDFIRKHRSDGRLLDVGCAYGFFLQEARPFFDPAGIEIAEDAAAYCRQQVLRVLSGVADEDHLAQLGMMDVIVLLDVVEHLPSPHETLALCTRYLSPGGVIVITTGDFASRYARVAGARWRLMRRRSITDTSTSRALSGRRMRSDFEWSRTIIPGRSSRCLSSHFRLGACLVCAPSMHRGQVASGFQSICSMLCALCCGRAGDSFLSCRNSAERAVPNVTEQSVMMNARLLSHRLRLLVSVIFCGLLFVAG